MIGEDVMNYIKIPCVLGELSVKDNYFCGSM